MSSSLLHSEDAEQAVLAACLIESGAVTAARGVVTADDFFAARHRVLFRAIVSVASNGLEVDPITLAAQLIETGELEVAGGKDYLGFLVDAVPTAANVRYHASIVQQCAARRGILATIASAQTALTSSGPDSLETIAGTIQTALSKAVTHSGRRGFAVVTGEEILDLADAVAARRAARELGQVVGVATGYPEIDNQIGGFKAGELVIIGARPKCGKTALVLNIAVNAIVDTDAHGGFVSTEMLRGELLERAANRLARLTTQQTASGHVTDAEVERFARALMPLKHRLHIDHEAFPTLENVIARSMDLKARHPEISFLVVDYLQRVSKRMKGRRGDEEIAAVTQGMKALAKELGIPVFAPAQVNYKETDKRDSKAPTSADLQGGSGFAQDANFLFLLHRPALFDPNPDLAHVLMVELAESRRTPKFTARLDWHGQYMAIDSHERRARALRQGAA